MQNFYWMINMQSKNNIIQSRIMNPKGEEFTYSLLSIKIGKNK